MRPDQWQRAKQVLYEAIEREPSGRAEFLATACAGDEELLREVDALLRAHEQASSFMDVTGSTAETREPANYLSLGTHLGIYEIKGLIGAGGMDI